MDEWADSIAGETEGDFAVVGASMGGYCALALARRAPERVRGLLLVGARPDADTEERRAGRGETIQLIRNEGVDGLWRMVHAEALPRSERGEQATGLSGRRRAGHRTRGESATGRTRPTWRARFRGPVQFVVGEFDPYVSAAELEEFEVRELQGVGHLVNLERPDEFNEILREFVDRV